MLDMSNAPKIGRSASLKRSINLLHSIKKNNATIVEIGCIRGAEHGDMVGDGWSSLLFSWYCHCNNGNFYTIDRDMKAINICKKLTYEYNDCVNYICDDSLAGLKEIKNKNIVIDLLYLDGHANPEYSKKEYDLIKNNLHSKSIILIDDSHIKGTILTPQLVNENWNNFGILDTQQLFVGKN